MSKAARRAWRERLHENERVQAKLKDPDAQPGNRALRRSGALDKAEQTPVTPVHLRRFRRALDKALRGPREN
jgi:hypothetical protein